MFGKKMSASSRAIMAMGQKAGNLKKSKMGTPVKSGPVPPVAKKKNMSAQGNPHPPTKGRTTLGGLGKLKFEQ